MRIAKGELVETLDHLAKAREQNYLTETEHDEMVAFANRAIGASTNLVKYLEKEAVRRKQPAGRRR